MLHFLNFADEPESGEFSRRLTTLYLACDDATASAAVAQVFAAAAGR